MFFIDNNTYKWLGQSLFIDCLNISSYTKSIVKYIRILGLSNKGKKYINSIKKDIDVPLITNINKNNIGLLELELRVDNIYNLIFNRNDNLYSKKPIIKDV